MSDHSFPLAMAAIHMSLHSLRILAQRGLVSPEDADESLDGVFETLENLEPERLVVVQRHLDPLFAEIKQIASAKWKPAE
ncbi:hypothetical protein [Sphingosinicella microcystinivorans]|uniref:Uncharacterized protein n=1 Tax=Sphingosinicella microcystinivorans TaxID=335406 RepID=A0AAD1D753_SPHMI|nr:hypothetical protein [Sphingosinicella microcystinivorans]BBE34638.1 hypothetical protein SmB9_22960 [Sphingosinicella microcystinivorans]|tara:strand:+ start:11203 stop:11442 length:240 start_codon:yes stop_codon:yes gene_type:complete